jgi:hypothetical protein
MHPGSYQYNRFPKLKSPVIFRKQVLVEQLFILIDFILVIVRCYGQQMHISPLRTFGENLLVIVKIIVIEEFTQILEVLDILLVGVWIAEGEVDLFGLAFEPVLKNTL